MNIILGGIGIGLLAYILISLQLQIVKLKDELEKHMKNTEKEK